MRQPSLTVVLAGAVASPAWAQSATGPLPGAQRGRALQRRGPGHPAGIPAAAGRMPRLVRGPTAGPSAVGDQLRRRGARRWPRPQRPRRLRRRSRIALQRTPAQRPRRAGFEQGFRDGRSQGWDDRDQDRRYDPTQHRALRVRRSRLRAARRRQERVSRRIPRRLPRRLCGGLPRRDDVAPRARAAVARTREAGHARRPTHGRRRAFSSPVTEGSSGTSRRSRAPAA